MPLSTVLGAQSLVQPAVCTTATRPASPYTGQAIYDTTLSQALVWNGTAWVVQTAGVVQVKSTTVTASTFSTASSSFVDVTGLSVSITPTSASNKVLIMSVFSCGLSAPTEVPVMQFVRGATAIGLSTGGGSQTGTLVGEVRTQDRSYNFSMQFLDSPATTSATTYKVQTKALGGGYTFYLNRRGSSDQDNSISTITVMEVTP